MCKITQVHGYIGRKHLTHNLCIVLCIDGQTGYRGTQGFNYKKEIFLYI